MLSLKTPLTEVSVYTNGKDGLTRVSVKRKGKKKASYYKVYRDKKGVLQSTGFWMDDEIYKIAKDLEIGQKWRSDEYALEMGDYEEEYSEVINSFHNEQSVVAPSTDEIYARMNQTGNETAFDGVYS